MNEFVSDHWFKFPDLAAFPDYADEYRYDGEYDRFMFYDAWARNSVAELDRAIDTVWNKAKPMIDAERAASAKWRSRIATHFAAVRARRPGRGTGPLAVDGCQQFEYDGSGLRKKLSAEIKELEAKHAWRPPVGTYDRGQMVSIEQDVSNLFTGLGITHSVAEYAGRQLTVQAVFLHVAMPGDQNWRQFFYDAKTTPRLTNTHIDPKTNVIKAIVYLEPYAGGPGAFRYVPGSHRFALDPIQDVIGRAVSTGSYCPTPDARAGVFRLPAEFRVSHNFGRCLLDGTPEADTLEKHLRWFNDGIIVFDPQGIHQGGGVLQRRRLALQVLLK